jgi:type II secretory pathway component PulK
MNSLPFPRSTRLAGRQRGSAVLIVLALLACIALILAATSTTLTFLGREIQRLDQHQLKKYGQSKRH